MEKIAVKIKPGSKEAAIIKIDKDNVYHISVKSPADKDKANKELLSFLSKKFGKTVRILSGLKSRHKVLGVY